MAGAPIPDNAYGSPGEESQRGPRTVRGTKTPNRVTRPYPKRTITRRK